MATACQPCQYAARRPLKSKVIEYTPVHERTHTEMYHAAVGWAPAAALEREEIVRAHR